MPRPKPADRLDPNGNRYDIYFDPIDVDDLTDSSDPNHNRYGTYFEPLDMDEIDPDNYPEERKATAGAPKPTPATEQPRRGDPVPRSGGQGGAQNGRRPHGQPGMNLTRGGPAAQGRAQPGPSAPRGGPAGPGRGQAPRPAQGTGNNPRNRARAPRGTRPPPRFSNRDVSPEWLPPPSSRNFERRRANRQREREMMAREEAYYPGHGGYDYGYDYAMAGERACYSPGCSGCDYDCDYDPWGPPRPVYGGYGVPPGAYGGGYRAHDYYY